LLDAAERLLVDEGYAAVTSRRVANEVGLNNALIYYYFGSMDALFIAVYRRRADWMLERQAEALASPQPLWALWDVTHTQANSALNFEFIALGNHRAAIKAEIVRYSARFRQLQVDALAKTLGDHPIDQEAFPIEGVIVILAAVSRFLVMEDSYGLDTGHAQAVAIVERALRQLEGERAPVDREPVVGPPG
jgi:AcrR family transcriptional regulator